MGIAFSRSADGITWRESRVAGPFDLAIAPNAGGLFLGDYQALTSIGAVFVPFYVQTNNGNLSNRTDVFAELATMASSAAAQASAEKSTAESEARLPARVAEVSRPTAISEQFRRRVHDAIVQTMQRRVPAWEEVMRRKNAAADEP